MQAVDTLQAASSRRLSSLPVGWGVAVPWGGAAGPSRPVLLRVNARHRPTPGAGGSVCYSLAVLISLGGCVISASAAPCLPQPRRICYRGVIRSPVVLRRPRAGKETAPSSCQKWRRKKGRESKRRKKEKEEGRRKLGKLMRGFKRRRKSVGASREK